MAKWEGDQVIPAEWLDLWRAAVTDKSPKNITRKRYPYRVPTMQTLAGHPSVKQKKQRDRFMLVKGKFKTLTWEQRQRWYAAMPEWGSLLWYYNFFMLSGLMDVMGADARGAQVIKKIQNIKDTIPVGGKTVAIPVAVDTSKVVVMLWGSSYQQDSANWEAMAMCCWDGGEDERSWTEYTYWAWPVYPVWSNLQANSIDISWATAPKVGAAVSIQIIEYI